MSSSALSRLSVLVVGAGPAGLCAAAALKQEGHTVTVLERQQGLQPRGNALVIQPAAVKALANLDGAHEALSKVSSSSERLHWWSYKGAKPFAVTTSTERRFETDRPSVQRVLYQLAVANRVQVCFGKTVDRVQDDGEKAKLWTAEGDELSADLIIGADGIKSVIRKSLFPEQNTDPVPIREAIFLARLPISKLEKDSRLAGWLEPGTTHGTLGPDRFILSRPLHGSQFGVQFIDIDHGDPVPVDGNWNTPADLGILRARFADFNTTTQACLDHIDTAERWQIAVGAELDTWHSDKGQIVLLGDAAHAMIPHAAQGLSQGIEDALSLARMLRWADQCGVSAVTKTWAKFRRPRVDMFVKRSMSNAKSHSLPDGPEQEARDEQIKQASHRSLLSMDDVEMDMMANQRSPEFQKWVRAWDVVTEAEKEMSNFRV